MNYQFPTITHINDVLDFIINKPEFVVIKKNGYTVIDYVVQGSDTFPPVLAVGDAILRELRGIIFDTNGNIVRRPHHKFFNYGERLETLPENVDLDGSHVYEKLDGSMISPFRVDNCLLYGTKKGVTEIAAQIVPFLLKNRHYDEFSLYCINHQVTPIYEWCSRKQLIVIDYPDDDLVLTSMRHMISGEYIHLHGDSEFVQKAHDLGIRMVKCVTTLTSENFHEFVSSVADLKNIEGFVLVKKDGHKIKIKTDEYITLHSAVDILQSERKVFKLVVSGKADDLKSTLSAEKLNALNKYECEIWTNIKKTECMISELTKIGQQLYSNRADFANKYVKTINDKYSSFIYSCYGGGNVFDSIVSFLSTHCNTNADIKKYDWIFGEVHWDSKFID